MTHTSLLTYSYGDDFVNISIMFFESRMKLYHHFFFTQQKYFWGAFTFLLTEKKTVVQVKKKQKLLNYEYVTCAKMSIRSFCYRENFLQFFCLIPKI